MKRTTGIMLTVVVLGLLMGCSNTGPVSLDKADAFITKPLASSPASASMSVEYSSITVSWTPTSGTNPMYTLKLDTQDPPVTVVSTGADTFAVVTGLVPQTRYYWQVSVSADEGSVSSDEFVFTTKLLGLEQYYASTSVRALAIQGGVVWVGRAGAALEGIQNGAVVASIPNTREIVAMEVDQGGTLWAVSWSGVISRTSSGTVTDHWGDSLAFNSLAVDVNGGVLVGTNARSVKKYISSTWTKVDAVIVAGTTKTLSTPIQALAVDPVANLANAAAGVWIGTSAGVYVIDDGASAGRQFTTAEGLPENNITALAVASTGTVWAGTRGSGLATFNGTTWSAVSGLTATGTGAIASLTADATGGMWVGTNGGGLVHLAADGTLLKNYSASNSALPSNTVYDICIEASGKVWVATGMGLIAFQPQ